MNASGAAPEAVFEHVQQLRDAHRKEVGGHHQQQAHVERPEHAAQQRGVPAGRLDQAAAQKTIVAIARLP
ncbi:MAG: hypothetical protein U1F11_15665 [Steroidobacteraceae bacterium]